MQILNLKWYMSTKRFFFILNKCLGRQTFSYKMHANILYIFIWGQFTFWVVFLLTVTSSKIQNHTFDQNHVICVSNFFLDVEISIRQKKFFKSFMFNLSIHFLNKSYIYFLARKFSNISIALMYVHKIHLVHFGSRNWFRLGICS